MATAAVEVLGPLAFVVVLELARLARDIPLVGHEGETDRLDYDDDPGRIVRVVTLVARRLGFSGSLVSVGGFHVVFTLTEAVLFGSVLIVYLTSGSIAFEELTEVGTSVGVVAFLGTLWVLLPVIVVDRYDNLSRQGVRPFSLDVHIVTTLLYLGIIVAFVEGGAAAAPYLSGLGGPGQRVVSWVGPEMARSVFVGALAAFLPQKSGLYRRYLRTELAHLDGVGVTDEGADGAVAADGSGDGT